MRAQGGGMILNVSSRVSKKLFSGTFCLRLNQIRPERPVANRRDELKKDGIVVSVFHPKMTATDFGKKFRRHSLLIGSRPKQCRHRTNSTNGNIGIGTASRHSRNGRRKNRRAN